MQIFHSPSHALHAARAYLADGTVRPCPESPARVDALLRALRGEPGAFDLRLPDFSDPLPVLRAIHAADYLEYLQSIHARWSAEFGPEIDVLPDTFPRHLPRTSRPADPIAQVGFYSFDMAAPIAAHTWAAAVESARTALSAAAALHLGHRVAYALCRPPGHHAGPDYCGGFCYLNNAAAATELLGRGPAATSGKPHDPNHHDPNRRQRVAILDIDYHHGNGTQDIFYAREDVLFVSLHADPNTQYPYFWGHASETGSGAGEGYTVNFPLPRGTEEARWLQTLDKALERIAAFGPAALVVSLGLDISQADPVGDFQLSLGAFPQIGTMIAGLRLPTVLVQEGGYNLDDLGPSLVPLLKAFDAA